MTQCPECGYIHPPEPPGECRVAKVQRLQSEIESNKNTLLYNETLKIQKLILDKLKNKQIEEIKVYISRILNFINNSI